MPRCRRECNNVPNRIKQLGYAGSYDTVKIHVRKLKKKLQRQAYIRFETIPGLQGQMDWADFQVVDLHGGSFTVYLFVLVLGFSRAMFARFVDRCTLQAFMDAHIHAYHYLGGIPLEMLYDNMKHVVISRKSGQTIFNVEFSHFAQHYGFKPVACPPYSPWVKGKVERPVDYIREAFWRGYTFSTIEQANRDLLQWLTETANRHRHGTHRQMVDMRWQWKADTLAGNVHLAETAAHDLNHRVRRSLSGRTACRVFFGSGRLGYTKRKRKEVYDWIRNLAVNLSAAAGKEELSPVAWRLAAKRWLIHNGLIRISKPRKVCTPLLSDFGS